MKRRALTAIERFEETHGEDMCWLSEQLATLAKLRRDLLFDVGWAPHNSDLALHTVAVVASGYAKAASILLREAERTCVSGLMVLAIRQRNAEKEPQP